MKASIRLNTTNPTTAAIPTGSGLLAGALARGTAGLVAAQDPTPPPTPSGWAGPGGMMGGQYSAGMMGGQQVQQMETLHGQMEGSGVCDRSQMQAFHAPQNPTR